MSRTISSNRFRGKLYSTHNFYFIHRIEILVKWDNMVHLDAKGLTLRPCQRIIKKIRKY